MSYEADCYAYAIKCGDTINGIAVTRITFSDVDQAVTFWGSSGIIVEDVEPTAKLPK